MTSNEKYKKALEKAKEALNDGTISRNTIAYLQDIFPELKESEDEESKKWILECLYDGLRKSDEQFKGQFKAAIAWLEKQTEQKPADWSEEDELMLDEIIDFFENGTVKLQHDLSLYAHWLKSLRHRKM